MALDAHKVSEIESHESAFSNALESGDQTFFHVPFRGRVGDYWSKWATISEAFGRLGLPQGARILDVGCGGGWSSTFLAEAGFSPLGIDISPAMVQLSKERAARCGVQARFAVADMDFLDLGEEFDAVLVFDALHHSTRQASVVAGVAKHLRPGGWVLFGEPSWLHLISPHARRVHRQAGWIERGVFLSTLKRDCRRAGLGEFRRFFEGTRPYESRTTEFTWNLARLVAANFAVAPQFSRWLAARKP